MLQFIFGGEGVVHEKAKEQAFFQDVIKNHRSQTHPRDYLCTESQED